MYIHMYTLRAASVILLLAVWQFKPKFHQIKFLCAVRLLTPRK